MLFWSRERQDRHKSLGINSKRRDHRSSPSPAKLLKGVEENSVTQTGRLCSFRGKGRMKIGDFRAYEREAGTTELEALHGCKAEPSEALAIFE